MRSTQLIRSQDKLIKRVDAIQEKERRALGRAEKTQAKILTDEVWKRHRVAFAELQAKLSAEVKTQGNEHFARTRSVTLAHAKASLIAEMPPPPPILDRRRGRCTAATTSSGRWKSGGRKIRDVTSEEKFERRLASPNGGAARRATGLTKIAKCLARSPEHAQPCTSLNARAHALRRELSVNSTSTIFLE